jgi:hypothetical protein
MIHFVATVLKKLVGKVTLQTLYDSPAHFLLQEWPDTL